MDEKVKREALQRIAIAQGHLGKVKEMLENEAYCPDVIHQSRAVQAALKKVDAIVFHGHLHTCVLHDLHKTGTEKEKLVDEIIDLFGKNSD